jgi:Family of unknown function (DUF6187)
MASGQPDTRFSLPAIDDPPSTEVGVILMGLEATQLLAGLGMAALADDPAVVALLAEQARHDGTAGDLAELGLGRWRAERDAFGAATPPPDVSLRTAWAQAYRDVAARKAGAAGPAIVAYLTACWLRAIEVDTCCGPSR